MSSGKNQWTKCISAQGGLRGVAVQAGPLVREICEQHKIRDGALAQSLGEALLGGILLASFCKGSEKINLNIRGTGRCRQALVDASADGFVRGYVIEREQDPEAAAASSSSFGPWGEGVLSILRTKEGDGSSSKQPYIGTVPLVTGHLAKDLTYYWAQSEQVPSAVGLVVNVKKNEIVSAGAFMVQVMPGAVPHEVRAVETQVQRLSAVSEEFAKSGGEEPMKLLSEIFQDISFHVLENRPIAFRCACSMQRVERALVLVGTEELSSMIQKDRGAMVRCDFCGKQYNADEATLKRLMEAAR